MSQENPTAWAELYLYVFGNKPEACSPTIMSANGREVIFLLSSPPPVNHGFAFHFVFFGGRGSPDAFWGDWWDATGRRGREIPFHEWKCLVSLDFITGIPAIAPKKKNVQREERMPGKNVVDMCLERDLVESGAEFVTYLKDLYPACLWKTISEVKLTWVKDIQELLDLPCHLTYSVPFPNNRKSEVELWSHFFVGGVDRHQRWIYNYCKGHSHLLAAWFHPLCEMGSKPQVVALAIPGTLSNFDQGYKSKNR